MSRCKPRPLNGTERSGKIPFEIDAFMVRVHEAVRPFPKAALFELADEGHASPFEQLVACMISIRTRDETTLKIARNLFRTARTASEFCRMGPERIEQAIRGCTFFEPKARQLYTIAERIEREHGGVLPCDEQVLLSFPGIGPKCAHLILGIACGQSHIAVDIHVHRVMNRLGQVRTTTPEATMRELEQKLSKRYWVEINQLLVPFGKHICTGTAPRCSTCPVLEMCQQVGVTTHR